MRQTRLTVIGSGNTRRDIRFPALGATKSKEGVARDANIDDAGKVWCGGETVRDQRWIRISGNTIVDWSDQMNKKDRRSCILILELVSEAL